MKKMTTFFKECETKKKGEQLVEELTETYRELKTQNPEKYGSVVRFTVLIQKRTMIYIQNSVFIIYHARSDL